MEAARYSSRSVIVDPIYQTFRDKSYMLHKQKMQEINNRKFSQADAALQQKQLLKLKNSKKAVEKVNGQLDMQRFQNVALISHIQKIMNRKSQSFSSLRKFKSTNAEVEKKEIQRQNRILLQRIEEERMHKLSKKDIKKQIKQYEDRRDKLRKVNSNLINTKIKEKSKNILKQSKSKQANQSK